MLGFFVLAKVPMLDKFLFWYLTSLTLPNEVFFLIFGKNLQCERPKVQNLISVHFLIT